MNLDLVNNIVNDVKNNKFIQGFIKEIQNYLDNSKTKNIIGEKEDITLVNPNYNDKIISKYRDKMYIERAHILNDYAKKTSDKGEMYYIYDKNSKMPDGYNLCICEEGKSHIVIEKCKKDLPSGATIGSVLRVCENGFTLDEDSTKDISQEINCMKKQILKEQKEYLESKRIEGHIYEISETDVDRAFVFDITSGNDEEIEEIDFPKELLNDAKEGDLFIFENGEYHK